MDGKDLLEYIQGINRERLLEKFLNTKGYSNPNDEGFGLNHWSQRLYYPTSPHIEAQTANTFQKPGHLVSFLAVPSAWKEDLIDTNSQAFLNWLSEFKWEQIPRIQPPFTHEKYRACSEGLILPRWFHSSNEEVLESYLLIRRDGVIEFGFSREAYSHYEEFTIFKLIQITGRLWQFLIFVNSLYHEFIPESLLETLYIVNLRGTQDSLIGDLAEGWKQPIPLSSYNSYTPKCLEPHMQIRRLVKNSEFGRDVEKIVHWFATLIENGWGQLEPRCYVHPNIDDSKPFAQPKS